MIVTHVRIVCSPPLLWTVVNPRPYVFCLSVVHYFLCFMTLYWLVVVKWTLNQSIVFLIAADAQLTAKMMLGE